jgi:hypothetical protein
VTLRQSIGGVHATVSSTPSGAIIGLWPTVNAAVGSLSAPATRTPTGDGEAMATRPAVVSARARAVAIVSLIM